MQPRSPHLPDTTPVIASRLWTAVDSLGTYLVKVDRGTEAQTALLHTAATHPRNWHLTDRNGVPVPGWHFADSWAQTWLHEILDRHGCNDLLLSPVKYERAAL